MARPSPGAQRIIALLNFFADNPGRAFTLTDLIRALKINRSTLHSLLAELADANYLFRTGDKTYVLGSAAARLGRVASEHLSPLQVAHPEMRAIADRYDAVCSALFRERDEVVVRDRATAAARHDWYAAPVHRWPLRLPLGPMFFTWSRPSDLDAWFAGLAPPVRAADRELALKGLALVRARGFQVVVWPPDTAFTVDVDSQAELSPSRQPVIETDLDARTPYALASVAVPVRDAQGRVALVLSLSGFAHARTGAEITEMGGRLAQAGRNISVFLGRIRAQN